MQALWQDLRFAFRMLAKNRISSGIIILTLALGIGSNLAILGIINSVLLRKLPVPEPKQIVSLFSQNRGEPLLNTFSIPDFRDIRAQTEEVFSDLAGYRNSIGALGVENKADRVVINYVSSNFFSTLNLIPTVGRLISASDGDLLSGEPIMVVSYSYWKNHLGGNPSVVGMRAVVGDHAVTIVGVAPKGFDGMYPVLPTQVYLPLGMFTVGGTSTVNNRHEHDIKVFGRLRSGVNVGQARPSLELVAARLSREYPEEHKALRLVAFPEIEGRYANPEDPTMKVVSGLFLGLSGIVLLLACVNVVIILLAQGIARNREVAIRVALGAARRRIVMQLQVETVILAAVAAVGGVIAGQLGSLAVGAVDLEADVPVHFNFIFDWLIFVYTFGVAFATGVFVGILPALRITKGNSNETLQGRGTSVLGGRQRLRSVLVAAQMAGSLVLLIIAGLFTQGLREAQRTNLGFEPEGVINLNMDPTQIGYNQQQTEIFYRELLDRVRSVPGVLSASIAACVPMGYKAIGDSLIIDDYQTPPGAFEPSADYNYVSDGYFVTMNINVVRGRAFTHDDRETTQYVAIVSDGFANRYWPKQDVLGRQFKLKGDPTHSIEVIGVAQDVRFRSITGAIDPFFYMPFSQHLGAEGEETLQVRTNRREEIIIPEIQRVVASLSPGLPVFGVRTMTQALNTIHGLLIFRIGALLAGILGLLGMLLAVAGVYGVVSHDATQRIGEIGLRMALGAQPSDILRLLLTRGLSLVGIGMLTGLAASLAISRVFRTFFSLNADTLVTYTAVSLVLAGAAFLACYLPARRPMRADPQAVLRHE
jgi:predicted permease